MFKKMTLAICLTLMLFACSDNSDKVKTSDNMVVDSQFGYKIAHKDGKMGMLNEQGAVIIDFKYHSLRFSNDGKTLVGRHYDTGLMGFLDTTGKEILPFQYRKAGAFSEGLAGVSLDGKKMGFINTQGQWVIQPQYDWGVTAQYEFTNGAVVVYKKAPKEITNPLNKQTTTIQMPQSAVINTRNEMIVPFGKYEDIDSFREGLARVEVKVPSEGTFDNGKMDLGRRFGFIDTRGKLIIPTQYYDAASFREGLANVAIKDKYGFIDKQGNTVIPFEYDNILHSYFINGYAPMMKTKKKGNFSCAYGVIDKNNREIISFKYDLIQNVGEIGGFRARKCGKSDTIRLDYNGKRIKE